MLINAYIWWSFPEIGIDLKEILIMKGETLDRRIRKTRRVIRQCLTELLKTKRIQDITVREISEKADINRGTFYLHYRDIFDLMEQIENELLEELEDVLNHFKASDLLSNPALVFTRVFHLVKENSDMVSILIGQNGDINFVNRLKDIVREKCLKDWMELFRPGAGGGRQTSRSSQNTLLDDSAFEAYYSFTVTGCFGLVQYWLDSGLKETPEQLASLV